MLGDAILFHREATVKRLNGAMPFNGELSHRLQGDGNREAVNGAPHKPKRRALNYLSARKIY